MSDPLWSDWHIEEWCHQEQAAGNKHPDAATGMRNVRNVYEAALATAKEAWPQGDTAEHQLTTAIMRAIEEDWSPNDSFEQIAAAVLRRLAAGAQGEE